MSILKTALDRPAIQLPRALELQTDDRPRLPVVAPSPTPAASASKSGNSGDQSHPPSSESLLEIARRQGKTLLAGWAASLMVHFVLLLLLALISFGNASTKLGLELAFSDGVEAIDFDEVSFEMPALAETTMPQDLESLEAIEDEAEQPVIELADEVMDAALETEPMFAEASAESGQLEGVSEQQVDGGQIAGGAGASDAESGARFYGIESEGNRFVFVIDASTSMLDGGRWGRAVEELLESISQLKSSQKFLVLTYSSSFRPMMNMPMGKIDLVRATRGNKRRLTNWLYNQRPNGVTMPAGAMMVGLSLNVDAIYLLSDGLLMDRTDFMLRQHNQPRLLRYGGGRKTPVHTIAMDIDGDGADLLRMIAEENAGVFRVVD